MTAYKRCNTCHELFTSRDCPRCAAKHSKRRREKIESLALYHKARWKKCRRDVRLKWLDYDIWALGVGRVVKLDKVVVHHIYERDDRPDLVYDLDNLITVSRDSHTEIHKLYETDRAAALERIERGKAAFREVIMYDDGGRVRGDQDPRST